MKVHLFADVIRKEQLYEGLALNLIEIGFTSGKGEAVMQQLSDEYQQEVSHKTEHYLNVIESNHRIVISRNHRCCLIIYHVTTGEYSLFTIEV